MIAPRTYLYTGLLATICTLLFTSIANAQNWPAWRNADMTGIAPMAKIPTEWSESKNIKWKTEIPGKGMSTPIIWKNKVFLLTAVDLGSRKAAEAILPNAATPTAQDRRRGGGRFGASQAPNTHDFIVMCLDRNTGKTIWKKTAITATPHEGHHRDHSFASYSPITDGKHLWVSFGSRGLYCYNLDGELIWKKELPKMRTRNSFGEGSSPTIVGNKLIAVMDHEGDSYIIAVDKTNGKTIWQKSRDEKTSWTSPRVITHEGKTQIVVAGTNKTRAYNPDNGEIIWTCSGQTTNVIPTPVTGFGMIYCTSGYRGNSLQAIQLGKSGDLSNSDAIKWEVKRLTPYVPSPILVNDKIYVHSSNSPIISCYNAKTGEPYYTGQRLSGISGIYASPIATKNNIYLIGRSGTVKVIKNTDTYQEIATNKLDDRIDASPAIAGDQLFIRGHKYLYCISEK